MLAWTSQPPLQLSAWGTPLWTPMPLARAQPLSVELPLDSIVSIAKNVYLHFTHINKDDEKLEIMHIEC